MTYIADEKRYDGALFNRCGRSGIVLPPISLGLWQNFGGVNVFETGRAVVRRAFDRGVTHFDLANKLWAALWICRRELRSDSEEGLSQPPQ